jgi:hypothetical protein
MGGRVVFCLRILDLFFFDVDFAVALPDRPWRKSLGTGLKSGVQSRYASVLLRSFYAVLMKSAVRAQR